ncbi:MAG: SpoIIE family protein phosphatase [Cyclobacteriaceae bacterium]|nr:SpoIIE family protein phosphatase [Cyclobacteriaceae bacterium HetDA_MAG_MS6]
MVEEESAKRLLQDILTNFQEVEVCGVFDRVSNDFFEVEQRSKSLDIAVINQMFKDSIIPVAGEDSDFQLFLDYGKKGMLVVHRVSPNWFIFITSPSRAYASINRFLEQLQFSPPSPEPIVTEDSEDLSTTKEFLEELESAKRIQSFILTDQKVLEPHLSEYFLYYQPESVIGGDFYQFKVFGDIVYLIVGDCTGHGVEGALSTMTVGLILNRVIHSPDQDLAEAMEQITSQIQAFNENNQAESAYGIGAEIGICRVHKKESKIAFATTGVPLLHSSNGEMTVIKARKNHFNGLAKVVYEERTFKPGDTLFQYTDGLADQFDVNNKRKLGTVGIKDICKNLLNTFSEKQFTKDLDGFRGKTPQLDDITFLAFRL